LASEFEVVDSEEAGLKLYTLILKRDDLTAGYVIYQVPPAGIAEILIGSKWNRKEIEEMKKVVEEKIGKGISITISKIEKIVQE